MDTVYKQPKAKKIYVVYDIDDPDDLMSFRTLEKATEDLEMGSEDVIAVYQLVGLVDIKIDRKLTKKIVNL